MRIKFVIENSNDTFEIHPYSGKDLSLTWEREDERKYDFKKELKEIVLIKEDYNYFYALEKSDNRCDLQTIYVYLVCGIDAEDFQLYSGTFSMSQGQWDYEKCQVKFKLKYVDAYTCIDENDDDINLLQKVIPSSGPAIPTNVIPIEFAVLGVFINIETYVCPEHTSGCNQEFLDAGQWRFVKQKRLVFSKFNLYVRMFMLVNFDYAPSEDWIYIEDVEFGKKYAKEYRGDDIERIADLFINDSEVETIVYYPGISQINNGFKLKNAMQYLLDQACGENLTIVSNFFQWNPDLETSFSYVTGTKNNYRNLKLFQKSDVKRMGASNFATIAESNFKDLLQDICNIFNLGYKITDDIFRLEHISYFETDLGLNLTRIDSQQKYLRGTRKYGYDDNKMPKFEKFVFMDAHGSGDFLGKDIVYTSNCVNNNIENKTTNSIERITTDVMLCIENPSSQSEFLTDDGFVLVACDDNDFIIYKSGILDPSTSLNNVLGWSYLHRDLWKHGRVLESGLMNDEETEFLSVIPTIKQDKITSKLGCNHIQLFNPLDKIKASLGWGFVQTAELKLFQCMMDFELFLDEIEEVNYENTYGDFSDEFNEEFD